MALGPSAVFPEPGEGLDAATYTHTHQDGEPKSAGCPPSEHLPMEGEGLAKTLSLLGSQGRSPK